MTQDILTDAEIEALTGVQRRELIQRLERPMAELRPRGYAERLRQAHLGLMTGGALFMIPWIIYLGLTLPQNYTVRDWPFSSNCTFCAASAGDTTLAGSSPVRWLGHR